MANNEHPLQGLMNVTLEKIKEMVDSNTIIGNPINTPDGSTILPVSRVNYGFTSGGSDFISGKAPKEMFGGGSGAGVSITPVAFLVLHGSSVRLVQLAEKNNTVDRVLNLVPEVMDKVQGFVDKHSSKSNNSEKKSSEKNSATKNKDKVADIGKDSTAEEIVEALKGTEE